ncbi:hypothetical protein KI387_005409, partial [Taxus chinensis]
AYVTGDVFVTPSESKTLGFVVLEAISSGVPILASSLGGIPNILSVEQEGKTCFIFTPGDIYDFLCKAKLMLNSTEPRLNSGKARRSEVEKHDWRAATKKSVKYQHYKSESSLSLSREMMQLCLSTPSPIWGPYDEKIYNTNLHASASFSFFPDRTSFSQFENLHSSQQHYSYGEEVTGSSKNTTVELHAESWKPPYVTKIDTLFFALEVLKFRSIGLMITETRWSSNGGPKELATTPDNATTYNGNLVRHMINNTGTPSRLGQEIDTYIFSIFNKNIKLFIESERNRGLFYPDENKVYNVDITTGFPYLSIGGTLTSFNGATWCISSSSANETDIQKALDWACGSGNVDFSPIQLGQPCSLPDSLSSNASYAFNSYDQKNGHSSMACNFGGTRNITTNNPTTDVVNTILDGTDGVMLSGESAAREYPELAVKIMSHICIEAKSSLEYGSIFQELIRSTPLPMSPLESLALNLR